MKGFKRLRDHSGNSRSGYELESYARALLPDHSPYTKVITAKFSKRPIAKNKLVDSDVVG